VKLTAMLLLCLLTMSMLLGVLVLVVARGERKSLALRLWGWGLVVYALGMLTIISVVFLPQHLTQIEPDECFVLGDHDAHRTGRAAVRPAVELLCGRAIRRGITSGSHVASLSIRPTTASLQPSPATMTTM